VFYGKLKNNNNTSASTELNLRSKLHSIAAVKNAASIFVACITLALKSVPAAFSWWRRSNQYIEKLPVVIKID